MNRESDTFTWDYANYRGEKNKSDNNQRAYEE